MSQVPKELLKSDKLGIEGVSRHELEEEGPQGGKKATLVTLPNVLFGSVVGGLLLIASQWYLTQQVEPPPEQIAEDPQRKKHIEKATAMPGFSAAQAPALSVATIAVAAPRDIVRADPNVHPDRWHVRSRAHAHPIVVRAQQAL